MPYAHAGLGFSLSDLYKKPAGWAEDAWDWASDGDNWADVGKVAGCKLPTGMIVGGAAGAYFGGPAGMSAGAGAGGAAQAALASKFCPKGGVPVMVDPRMLPPAPPPPWYKRSWAPPVVIGGVLVTVVGLAMVVKAARR